MAKIPKKLENMQIDKKDIEIIKILEEDSRMSILELGRKVKLSHETVRYRINKLVKKGIIEKFTVSVNKNKLGFNNDIDVELYAEGMGRFLEISDGLS